MRKTKVSKDSEMSKGVSMRSKNTRLEKDRLRRFGLITLICFIWVGLHAPVSAEMKEVRRVKKPSKQRLSAKKVLIEAKKGVKSAKEKSIVYVFSKHANLMIEPSLKSEVIRRLEKGQKVRKIEKRGTWYKVKVGKQTGWIVKYLVTDQDPSINKPVVEMKRINLKKDARKRASSFSTAASARGLSDEKEAIEKVKADMKAVKKMEDRKVSDQDLKKFIGAGALDKE
ncbi:MAG: SH3-like domain-containing protein [Candidatus Marinamargulisbacteria bacterium]